MYCQQCGVPVRRLNRIAMVRQIIQRTYDVVQQQHQLRLVLVSITKRHTSVSETHVPLSTWLVSPAYARCRVSGDKQTWGRGGRTSLRSLWRNANATRDALVVQWEQTYYIIQVSPVLWRECSLKHPFSHPGRWMMGDPDGTLILTRIKINRDLQKRAFFVHFEYLKNLIREIADVVVLFLLHHSCNWGDLGKSTE